VTIEAYGLRRIIIEHDGPGQASPVVLAALPADVQHAIEQIQRDPIAAPAEPPAPDGPDDRAARRITWAVNAFIYIGGLVIGIGVAGFAVIQLLRGSDRLYALMAAFGLASAFRCAMELVKHSNQD
jgi:hypothetical protein